MNDDVHTFKLINIDYNKIYVYSKIVNNIEHVASHTSWATYTAYLETS